MRTVVSGAPPTLASKARVIRNVRMTSDSLLLAKSSMTNSALVSSIFLMMNPGRRPARSALDPGSTRVIIGWPSTRRRSIPMPPDFGSRESSSITASGGMMLKCDC